MQDIDYQRLSTSPKKLLHNFGALGGQHSAFELHLVVQGWVIHHGQNGMNRSSFGIVHTVNQTTDASVNECPRTHGAGFNCSKQVAADQAMIAKNLASFTKGDDLGVGGGIVGGEIAIPATSDDAAVEDDDGADGDFASFEGALGGAKGLFHPEFVG